MAEDVNLTKPVSGKNMQDFKANMDGAFVTQKAMTAALQLKLGVNDKAKSAAAADSATTAGSATKAAQDGEGNNIAETYATKKEVPDTSTFLKDADLPVFTDAEVDAAFTASDAKIDDLTGLHGVYVGSEEPSTKNFSLWIKL